MEKFNFTLINDISTLEELFKCENKVVAIDTETKGLDFNKPRFLVGLSFAFNGNEAYYVPIAHQGYPKNIDIDLLRPILQKFLDSNSTLFFNLMFDLKAFESAGILTDKIKCFEVQALTFLWDSDTMLRNLKFFTNEILGREVIEFSEFGVTDFSLLDPEDQKTIDYASADAANTFALFSKLYPKINKECPFTLKLDVAVAKALHRLTANKVLLDNEYINKYIQDLTARKEEIRKKIFSYVGYVFNPSSKIQLTNALLSIGVDTGERTKNGYLKANKDNLPHIGHPIGPLLVEHLSLSSKISNITKLKGLHEGYFSFKPYHVPSGRLAAGSDARQKDSYYLQFNSQNLSKGELQMCRAEPSSEPGNILGWKFVPDKEGKIEGREFDFNHRNILKARDGYTFAQFDYCISGETLVYEKRYGLMKIKDLLKLSTDAPKYPIKLKTPRGYKRAFNIRTTGVKRKCKLKFKDGTEIVCSEDHKFFCVNKEETESKWFALKDIPKGWSVYRDPEMRSLWKELYPKEK